MAGEILLNNCIVITLNQDNEIFEQGAVLVRNGVIEDVGRDVEAPPDYSGPVRDLQGRIVLPGTVNCHCHFEEMAVRSLNYGLPLEPWLPYKIAAIRYMNMSQEEFTALLALACLEMLENGVTSGLHHMGSGLTVEDDKIDAAIHAYRATGLRAALCPLIADKTRREEMPIDTAGLPEPARTLMESDKAPPTELLLERAEAAIEKAEAAGSSRISGGVGPSAPQRCSDELLRGCAELAEKRNVPLHTHLLESRVQAHQAKQVYGSTIPEHLQEVGYLSPRASFAHSIWLTDSDIELLAANGCRVAHNPGSNLKLGSGIAPVRKYLDAGIPVGLGIDGANSSDKGSVFHQAHLAAQIHNVRENDPERGVTPSEAIRMAAWGGASVMLMEDRVGSIEPGKAADLVVLGRTLNYEPMIDPINSIAFAEDGESVDEVFVEGESLVRNGRTVFSDREDVLKIVDGAIQRLRENLPAALAEADELRPHLLAVSRNCANPPWDPA